MDFDLHAPGTLVAAAALLLGAVLLVQARFQSRMLRRRLATGAGTVVFDPATGLYSAAAMWQCMRAEANRATRLELPLHVWVGTAPGAEELDELGRELAFSMPRGAMGIRLGQRQVCVLSCAGASASAGSGHLVEQLDWSTRVITPDEDAATRALAFVAEVGNA